MAILRHFTPGFTQTLVQGIYAIYKERTLNKVNAKRIYLNLRELTHLTLLREQLILFNTENT